MTLEMVKYLIGGSGVSGFGSNSTAEHVTSRSSLHSFTAIITGATSGIGGETARVLSKRGARVIIPARNLKAGLDVKASIERETPTAHIIVMELDLTSFASISTFAKHFLALDLPLNILINNAGRFCTKFELSEDGYEMTFATNYLGHFLLTKLLLNKMIQTAEETGIQGRIVNVSSSIHKWVGQEGILLHQLNNPKFFNPRHAYALSKLANILHANELSVKLKEMKANVTANSVHPGIGRTNITRDCNRYMADLIFFVASKFLKSIPQAASTTCYVAVNEQVQNKSGKYFADCNEEKTSDVAQDCWKAKELWEASHEMTKSYL